MAGFVVNVKQIATAPFRVMGAGLKALGSMRWATTVASWGMWFLPGSRYDYAREVGDGTGSSIVVAVVNWIARTFPEAPPSVIKVASDGTRTPSARHAMARKIERPNAYYSGVLMWMATLYDWTTDGNAYWIKIRDKLGAVAELWWAPAWTMEPVGTDTTFIDHYVYKPDPGKDGYILPNADVVHFRYNLDPNNPRKGLSPLRSLLREIFTDDEGANMTATLMRNIGVPGVIISPSKDMSSSWKEADAEEARDKFQSRFTGDNRGKPLIFSGPTDVKVLGFSPDEMNLRDLRRVPEERVTAVLGVAAVVVGLGAGLDRSTFQNFAEARSAAYQGNIMPTQRLMASDLTSQLLPDFESDESAEVEFDVSRVRALQEDVNLISERMNRAVSGGWALVSDAKRSLNLPVAVDGSDDVYLRPLNLVATTPDGARVPSLIDASNAVGVLVRSGFDPEAALAALGLPAITHTGLIPVTLSAQDLLDAQTQAVAAQANGHTVA